MKKIPSIICVAALIGSGTAVAELVTFSSVTGSFDQGSPYIAANSIDGNVGTGWGVFGGQFQSQTGLFIPTASVSASAIEFVISNRFGSDHYLQEFRISTTTDAVPMVAGIWTPVPTTNLFSTNGTSVSSVGGGYVRETGAAATGRTDVIWIASGPFTDVTGFLLEMEPFDYDSADAVAASLGRSANGNLVLSEFTVTADPNTNWARFRSVGFYDGTGTPVAAYSAGQAVANLVDGNTSSFGHPVGQAGVSNDYYAQVDLGQDVNVESIDLTGRLDTDCCDDRLENYTLEFYAADGVTKVFSFVHTGQTKSTETIDIVANNNDVIPKARFVRVINTQGTNFGPQIGEIEVFGSLSDPPVIEPFEIIFVSAHPSSGNVELEFESVPGSTYAVYGSGNMTAWVLAESGITAVGDTATAEFMDINMLGASEYYYRVQLVP